MTTLPDETTGATVENVFLLILNAFFFLTTKRMKLLTAAYNIVFELILYPSLDDNGS